VAAMMVMIAMALLPASAQPPQYDYCGAPLVDTTQSAPAGMQLKHLMLTIRHGDRTPVGLYPLSYSDEVQWRCNLTQTSYWNTTSASQASPGRLYRKKYLHQREVLPGDCLFGQLTSIGQQQHHRLGASLRELYVNRYGLLSNQINTGEMWIRSTDVPRTIASAQSLLYGLYPFDSTCSAPVIDIHTMDNSKENMTPNPGLCARLEQVYRSLMDTPQWRAFLQERVPLDEKLRSIFSAPSGSPIDIINTFDMSFARGCHKLATPKARALLGTHLLHRLLSDELLLQLHHCHDSGDWRLCGRTSEKARGGH